MRSLLLASAAVILSAGIACAQTSSPAPTGAPNAAQVTQPGQSPGNMAPAPSSSGGSMSSPAQNSSSGSSNSPAPTGAPNAAQVTQPGQSPGNMAPPKPSSENMAPASMAPSTAGSAVMMSSTAKPMSHSMGMAMPQNAGPQAYLHIASRAISHGNKAQADEALNRAETRLLTRVVPAGDMAADSSPAVTSIENARQALAGGDMKSASRDVHMAIQQASNEDSASPSPASYNSGVDGGVNKAPGQMPTANFEKSSSQSGGMGSPSSTSDSPSFGSATPPHAATVPAAAPQ